MLTLASATALAANYLYLAEDSAVFFYYAFRNSDEVTMKIENANSTSVGVVFQIGFYCRDGSIDEGRMTENVTVNIEAHSSIEGEMSGLWFLPCRGAGGATGAYLSHIRVER